MGGGGDVGLVVVVVWCGNKKSVDVGVSFDLHHNFNTKKCHSQKKSFFLRVLRLDIYEPKHIFLPIHLF